MLTNLNNIPWASLTHAYGPAIDVPDLIKNLASTNEVKRKYALNELYGNIFHQGSRYEATPHVIPFILQLLQQDEVGGKDELIVLLVHLALGYTDELLPIGIDPVAMRELYRQDEAKLSPEELKQAREYGYSATALVQCYDLVNDNMSIITQYIDHEEIQVRKAALYALAWFPEFEQTSVPLLKTKLSNCEDEKELVVAILSLGVLAQRVPDALYGVSLGRYLNADSIVLRTASAIAIARSPMPPKVKGILEAADAHGDLEQVSDIHFNEGNLCDYADQMLEYCGVS
jgi:hypothetical protein